MKLSRSQRTESRTDTASANRPELCREIECTDASCPCKLATISFVSVNRCKVLSQLISHYYETKQSKCSHNRISNLTYIHTFDGVVSQCYQHFTGPRDAAHQGRTSLSCLQNQSKPAQPTKLLHYSRGFPSNLLLTRLSIKGLVIFSHLFLLMSKKYTLPNWLPATNQFPWQPKATLVNCKCFPWGVRPGLVFFTSDNNLKHNTEHATILPWCAFI